MSLFHSSSSSKTYGVLIDIGSGGVGIAIIESDRSNDTPTYLYTHREHMKVNETAVTRTEKIRQVREAVFAASLELTNNGLQRLHEHDKHARIKRILVTCASPWAHTVIQKISYEKETPFRITQALIHDLTEKAEEKAKKDLTQSEIFGKFGLQMVERATTSVSVNGYETDDPEGLDGVNITLSHAVGLVPEEIVHIIEEVKDQVLTEAILSTHTFMLVHYCIARDVLSNNQSFGMLDITEESSQYGIVSNGILQETFHIPYGSHTLIRDIAHETKGNTEHAVSLLKGYGEQTLNKKQQDNIEKALMPLTSAFSNALVTAQERMPLPSLFTMTVLPASTTTFEILLPNIIRSITGNIPEVHTMQSITKNEIKKNDGEYPDIFISLLGHFFHKLHRCGEIDVT